MVHDTMQWKKRKGRDGPVRQKVTVDKRTGKAIGYGRGLRGGFLKIRKGGAKNFKKVSFKY